MHSWLWGCQVILFFKIDRGELFLYGVEFVGAAVSLGLASKVAVQEFFFDFERRGVKVLSAKHWFGICPTMVL